MVNGAELKPYAVISACAAPIVCRFEFNFHAIAMQCNNIHISIMSAFVVVAVSAAVAAATAAAAIWNACVCVVVNSHMRVFVLRLIRSGIISMCEPKTHKIHV